jgi:uncharacterized protein
VETGVFCLQATYLEILVVHCIFKRINCFMRVLPVIFFCWFFCCQSAAQNKPDSRPQTPLPPFPYTADSLVYAAPADSLIYGVTLTIPSGKGPFPAVLLITGSGQQDRDETILGHKSFAVIADYLTRKGYLVMRVDDRGTGLSTGNFKLSTSYDFAKDVNNHIDFLKKRSDVDLKKIGLLGHSEGGMIAPLVASSRKDIAFVILLAGPGIPIGQLMAGQNAAILKSSGIDSIAAKSYSEFFGKVMPKIAAAPDSITARTILKAGLDNWRAGENRNRVVATTGIFDEKSENNYINQVVKQIYSPWFRAFLLFDPQPYLKKLNCKLLALNGDKDIQVLAGANLQGIQQSLEAGGNTSFTIALMPGLNHLFQTCKACTATEYGVLTESFSATALDKIGNWLQKEIPVK